MRAAPENGRFSPHSSFPPFSPPLRPSALYLCCPTVVNWQKELPASWVHGPHRWPVDRGGSERSIGRCNAGPWSPDRGCRTCDCSGAFWERGRCGSNAGNRLHTRDRQTTPWWKADVSVFPSSGIYLVYSAILKTRTFRCTLYMKSSM